MARELISVAFISSGEVSLLNCFKQGVFCGTLKSVISVVLK